MNAQFIRFTTEDRLILQGIIYHPDTVTKKAYLHVHGMGGNFYENRFIDVMAASITRENFAFVSINTRGHDTVADFPIAGDKEEFKRIGNAFEIFEECILDIRAAIHYLESNGYTDITLCGHSLGAAKVAYYQAITNDPRVKRLVLMSPPDMISLAEADRKSDEFVRTARQMLEANKGGELMPEKLWDGYYLSAKTYLNLATRDLPVDIFNVYDPTKPSLLAKISVPVFAFLGEKDDAATIPPQQALEIIKQKASSSPSFMIGIIEGAPHSYFGREEQMVKPLLEWLV